MPLLWALRGQRPTRGFVFGLVYGATGYGAIIYWIARFGVMAWVALTLLLALSTALFGLLVPIVTRPRRPLRNAAAVAALWTGVDHLRGSWPLGGFTWGSLGVSQVDNHLTARLATVAGVAGVTFVVVAVAALITEALQAGVAPRRRVLPLLVGGGLILAPIGIPFARAEGRALDIAIVQVDVRAPAGTSAAAVDRIVAERHIALTDGLASQAGPRPDLLLWGEGALDPAAAADPALMSAVRASVASLGAPALIGAVLDDPDGSQHTSVLAFDAAGEPAGRYDKVHLVPYGEYVPFRSHLGFVGALRQIPVDRVPGERIHTLSPGSLPAFGTPICFENSFPEITRAFVRDGATFLVVPVNNASYGFTAASDQHLQMSRIRAIEDGRWIVDAAISGVSAFIGPDGTVTERTDLFRSVILRGTIRTSTAQTPYVRWGDWFVWLCLLVVLGLAVTPPDRSSTPHPAPRPPAGRVRTLVILPTFNESATIAEVIERVLARPEEVDVLVVDDSSPDGTGDIVAALADREPRVRLRRRPTKSGLASAYLDGFAEALSGGYDLTVEMDADLSHDPDELSRLLEAAGAHDLTVGSRYVPGGSVSDWSRARVLLSKAGNTYARLMLGVPVRDATSGYRVYRRPLLEALTANAITSEGYGFQIELVLRAHRLGYDVGETPITFRERRHGESKISRRIVAEALWQVTRWGVLLRLRGRIDRAA